MTTTTTPAKLAKRWEVSTTLIYDMLNSGDLPGFRIGGKLWRIRLSDVEARERTDNGSATDLDMQKLDDGVPPLPALKPCRDEVRERRTRERIRRMCGDI